MNTPDPRHGAVSPDASEALSPQSPAVKTASPAATRGTHPGSVSNLAVPEFAQFLDRLSEVMGYVIGSFGPLTSREEAIVKASARVAYRWTLREVINDLTDKVRQS